MVVALAWVCIGLAVGIAAESLRHVRLLKEIDALQTHRTTAERLARDNSALESRVSSLVAEIDAISKQERLIPDADNSVLQTIPPSGGGEGVGKLETATSKFEKEPAPSEPLRQVNAGLNVTERMPWDSDELIASLTADSETDTTEIGAEDINKSMPWDASAEEESMPVATAPIEKDHIDVPPPQRAPAPDLIRGEGVGHQQPHQRSEKMPWDL